MFVATKVLRKIHAKTVATFSNVNDEFDVVFASGEGTTLLRMHASNALYRADPFHGRSSAIFYKESPTRQNALNLK